MTTLSRSERLKVLELVAEVAGEAAQNTNVVWMIEFQEELVEKLYRKMVALLEEPGAVPLLDYPAGTWGPETANRLFQGCEGGWSRG
jgi:glucose-6-phosphate 1-dehydrogenase